MGYEEKIGNLFDSCAEALVNTVNCEGAMGKGIALEFRRRFPGMFEVYRERCEQGMFHPGQILPYTKSKPYVLNFAVKSHWRLPSRLAWIDETLIKFVANYQRLGIRSVAFPWMGAMSGGLALDDVQAVMRKHLCSLEDIDVEVYTFDPRAPDPLFRVLFRYVRDHSASDLHQQSGLIKRQAQAVCAAFQGDAAVSMATLIQTARLGTVSTDKLYRFLISSAPTAPATLQRDLDS